MGVATTDVRGPDRAGEALEVRRNAGMFGLASLVAGVMAVAYAWRAVATGTTLLWGLTVVLAVVGVAYAVAWFDARSPLLVADALGVRLRDGHDWHGLPWDDVADVVVHPRRGLLGDGEIEVLSRAGGAFVVPLGLATVCSSADVAGAVRDLTRGQTAVTVVDASRGRNRSGEEGAEPAGTGDEPVERAVEDDAAGDQILEEETAGPERDEGRSPAGTTEFTETGDERLGETAADVDQPAPGTDRPVTDRPATDRLATDRPATGEGPLHGPDVDTADPAGSMTLPETAEEDASDAPAADPEPEREAAVAADAAPDRAPDPEQPTEPAAPRPVSLVASAGRAIRANISRPRPASEGTAALKRDPALEDPVRTLPEARELRGIRGRVDLVFEPLPVREHEVATDAAPIEEWPAQAAAEPVIGPQLAAVRERSGITVDSLAERTRIRPHVIEAIEVDDFAPCGGDFYARGHIRSLARVLGLDADPLVAAYDQHYAQAPVDARRVFEADLATGPQPSIRMTKGGPNWMALLGVVLVLAIIWGIGKIVTAGDDEPARTSTTVGAAAPAQHADGAAAPPTRNRLVLHGVGEKSKVVVRDEGGDVRWKGNLADGDKAHVQVPGRATVVAEHGDAVTVRVNGDKAHQVGGSEDRATLVRGRR